MIGENNSNGLRTAPTKPIPQATNTTELLKTFVSTKMNEDFAETHPVDDDSVSDRIRKVAIELVTTTPPVNRVIFGRLPQNAYQSAAYL